MILFKFSTGNSQIFPARRMKLIQVVAFIFLVLLATTPEESEANKSSWFDKIAKALEVKLRKNTYYARCNTRRVPPGIRCPFVVFGFGRSRKEAQDSARTYASTFVDKACARDAVEIKSENRGTFH